MEEKCPGLPSYKALYDCAQAFVTAESFPNGRLITYPADWGTRSRDIVDGWGSGDVICSIYLFWTDQHPMALRDLNLRRDRLESWRPQLGYRHDSWV